jgi:hypothetical protein
MESGCDIRVAVATSDQGYPLGGAVPCESSKPPHPSARKRVGSRFVAGPQIEEEPELADPMPPSVLSF